jgi:hypothetical protein
MPYIKPVYRTAYVNAVKGLERIFATVGAGEGDLNYVLTSVALAWLKYHKPPYKYATRVQVLAAFEAAKLEYYRRVMAPYEDKKIEVNGDVYPREVLS